MPARSNSAAAWSLSRPLEGTAMMSLRRHHEAPSHGGEQALGVDGGADRRHVRAARRARRAARHSGRRRRSARRSSPPALDLEHEARIIFEVAAELGGETRLRQIDAALLAGGRSGAPGVERRAQDRCRRPCAIMATRSMASLGGPETAR